MGEGLITELPPITALNSLPRNNTNHRNNRHLRLLTTFHRIKNLWSNTLRGTPSHVLQKSRADMPLSPPLTPLPRFGGPPLPGGPNPYNASLQNILLAAAQAQQQQQQQYSNPLLPNRAAMAAAAAAAAAQQQMPPVAPPVIAPPPIAPPILNAAGHSLEFMENLQRYFLQMRQQQHQQTVRQHYQTNQRRGKNRWLW